MRWLLIGATPAAIAAVLGGVGSGQINIPVPGIYGTITAAPTCPVERLVPQCAPRPLAATVDAAKSGHRVASTMSNTAGFYAMALRPGRYTIVVVTGSTLPRCPTRTVAVPKGASVRVDIVCDTGIR